MRYDVKSSEETGFTVFCVSEEGETQNLYTGTGAEGRQLAYALCGYLIDTNLIRRGKSFAVVPSFFKRNKERVAQAVKENRIPAVLVDLDVEIPE